MKRIFSSIALAALMSTAASAEVFEPSDCGSKYNRPIGVPNSEGQIVLMSVNTRSRFFCDRGIGDLTYVEVGEGGNNGDAESTAENDGGDHGGDCGEGGEHGDK